MTKVRKVLLLLIIALAACQPGTPTTTPTTTSLPPTAETAPSQTPLITPPTPTGELPMSPTPNPTPTSATNTGNADVTFVRAVLSSDGSWTFHVTVSHPDTGWDDYADGWDVLLENGTVLKPDPSSPFTRLLLHPHETEQPFTRSQSGIQIPVGITIVIVRAHDLVDGWGGLEVTVDLSTASGPNYEVQK